MLALIHYRITVDGQEVDRYWSATHTPLEDEHGRVHLVLQHTTDITELEQHRRASEAAGLLSRTRVVEERNVALGAYIEMFQRAFDGAPGFMCFLRGPEMRYELANAAYHQLVGPRERRRHAARGHRRFRVSADSRPRRSTIGRVRAR